MFLSSKRFHHFSPSWLNCSLFESLQVIAMSSAWCCWTVTGAESFGAFGLKCDNTNLWWLPRLPCCLPVGGTPPLNAAEPSPIPRPASVWWSSPSWTATEGAGAAGESLSTVSSSRWINSVTASWWCLWAPPVLWIPLLTLLFSTNLRTFSYASCSPA